MPRSRPIARLKKGESIRETLVRVRASSEMERLTSGTSPAKAPAAIEVAMIDRDFEVRPA